MKDLLFGTMTMGLPTSRAKAGSMVLPYTVYEELTSSEKEAALNAAQGKIASEDFAGALEILQNTSWKNPSDEQIHKPLGVVYDLYCQILLAKDLLHNHENVLRAALAAPTVGYKTIEIARNYFSRKFDIDFQDHIVNPRMFIGKYTYGIPKVQSWGAPACIFINRFSSIASEVTILTDGNHNMDTVTTYPFFDPPWNKSPVKAAHFTSLPNSKGDINIGPDVWIGHGATIMPGVTIGAGAVVAAKSVLTKSIAPYSIAAGNPARIVKSRFPPEIVKGLLQTQWWSWPDALIDEHLPLIMSKDINSFIKVGIRENESRQHKDA